MFFAQGWVIQSPSTPLVETDVKRVSEVDRGPKKDSNEHTGVCCSLRYKVLGQHVLMRYSSIMSRQE